MTKKTYTVTLRRSNGRYVKSAQRRSKYAAKKVKDSWEDRYDDAYYVEIEVSGGGADDIMGSVDNESDS